MIDIATLSDAAASLEPLPTSVTRLATLVADAPDLAEIVDIVQYDQALTGALLRGANSSWSAARAEITTVKDAVVRLGAGPVLSLALGVSVRARLAPAVPAYGLAEGELWSHSVAASLAAETLVHNAKVAVPVATPTAALLHDVGKLVMARFIEHVDLVAIGERCEAGSTRIEAEQAVVGVDHSALGGIVARRWELPDTLVNAIAEHHTPADTVSAAVHVADVVAKAAGGKTVDDNTQLGEFGRAVEDLGLTEASYDQIVGIVRGRYAEVSARFS